MAGVLKQHASHSTTAGSATAPIAHMTATEQAQQPASTGSDRTRTGLRERTASTGRRRIEAKYQ
jgi:negative regulator of sigma E activity